MENYSDFQLEILRNMEKESKRSVNLPDSEKLLLYLHSLFIITGQVDAMFCNAFIDEAIQLLKNSIFLYKDGLFDCAFYSIRQSSEVINTMLYLAHDPSKRKEWSSKSRFPMDSKIRNLLEQLSIDYKEIKSLIPEFFAKQENLIKQTHKIIHKQGLDTFYRARKPYAESYCYNHDAETKLFLDALKYTIGLLLIVFILIDPLCLILTDDRVTMKININPMTEPVDINYFQEFLGLYYIIDRIKDSEFYNNIILSINDKEDMNMATYCVVREEYWNIDSLDEIEKQLHLISPIEKVMFYILKEGIRVCNFYTGLGLGWYHTSISCNRETFSFNSAEFENFASSKNKFNQVRDNVFISVLTDYAGESLFIEHNEPLTPKDIEYLSDFQKEYLSTEEKFMNFLYASIINSKLKQ